MLLGVRHTNILRGAEAERPRKFLGNLLTPCGLTHSDQIRHDNTMWGRTDDHRGQTESIGGGGGAAPPNFLGSLRHPYCLTYRAIKFAVVTLVGRGVFLGDQTRLKGRAQRTQIFGTPLLMSVLFDL